MNKTLDQRFGVNLKKHIFLLTFAPNFLLFWHFFSFLTQKILEIKISISVLGAHHTNAGGNIQHTQTAKWKYDMFCVKNEMQPFLQGSLQTREQ